MWINEGSVKWILLHLYSGILIAMKINEKNLYIIMKWSPKYDVGKKINQGRE